MYITVDSKIQKYHVLKKKIQVSLIPWVQVVDLRRKAFKPQEKQKYIDFKGMIETNDVDVFVLEQSFESSKGSSNSYKAAKEDKGAFSYVEKQS